MPCNTVLISGAMGILGTAVGALLGHYLSKTWQREQWILDNRKQEYRELLSAISHSVVTLIARDRGVVDKGALRVYLEDLSTEVYRMLGDRIFIADDLAREHIREKWMAAVRAFTEDCKMDEFALRVYEIKEQLVHLALRPGAPAKLPTYAQKSYLGAPF
jgi:hypothetical protein